MQREEPEVNTGGEANADGHGGFFVGDPATEDAFALWGVLNLSPDSFSDGGKHAEETQARGHIHEMIASGAAVIDVGGASSRPRSDAYGRGAPALTATEELSRVAPLLSWAAAEFPATTFSIDTTQAVVAEQALRSGFGIVNDVCGANQLALLKVVAEHGAGYVMMHTRGDGAHTAAHLRYRNLIGEIREELLRGIDRAMQAGISPRRLWVDPGIGFAKSQAQSRQVLAHLDQLVDTGFPVLLGASRKSCLGEATPRPLGLPVPAARRDPASIAVCVHAHRYGVRHFRVHDVEGTRQALQIDTALRKLRETAAGAVPFTPAAIPES